MSQKTDDSRHHVCSLGRWKSEATTIYREGYGDGSSNGFTELKYFSLVWAGLWRNPVRTSLTAASITVAFLLFGLLQGVNQGMKNVYKNLDVERLYTQNRTDVASGLPLSYLHQIERVPHVSAVTYTTYFSGFFRDAQHSLPAFATDIKSFMRVYKDLKLSEGELQKILRTRSGVLVGKKLAQKYGWRVGDRIPVGSSVWTTRDGGSTWQFDIVGLLDTSAYGPGFASFYINSDYFEEERAFGKGTVHYFIVSIDDPRHGENVSTAIDEIFANSTYETKTQSEQAWAQAQLKQAADVNFIVNSIVGAVMFTLLFLTANTMMQSIRERIPQIGILKTLGFSNNKVLILILSEAAILCVISALIGLAVARAVFLGLRGLFGRLDLPVAVIESGVLMALVLALVSGLPPAMRARRLNISDALAGR